MQLWTASINWEVDNGPGLEYCHGIMAVNPTTTWQYLSVAVLVGHEPTSSHGSGPQSSSHDECRPEGLYRKSGGRRHSRRPPCSSLKLLFSASYFPQLPAPVASARLEQLPSSLWPFPITHNLYMPQTRG